MSASAKKQRTLKIVPTNSLHVWLRDFILDVRAANRAEATIGFYTQKLKAFLNYLEEQGITEPEGIKAPVIRSYLVLLGETHVSGGVHAYWRAIRAFVRFLVREDAIDRNPLEKMRAPKLDQDLLEPVSVETVNALLSTCDKTVVGLRDKAIILMLLDTGLRAGELTALDIGDVDLNDGSVAVRKTKNRKARFTFLGRQSRKAVAAYLRTRPDDGPKQPLWLAYQKDGDENRISYYGLRSVIVRRAEQANVPCPSLHSFRRSFALTMLRNGADLISLSRLMGHGSLPVLTRYLRQLKDDLGEVHAQHSPVDTLL